MKEPLRRDVAGVDLAFEGLAKWADPGPASPRPAPRLTAVTLLFALAAFPAAAQTREELPLLAALPAQTPNATEEVIYRFNNLDDRGFNRVVQQVTVPTLTVYHPAKASHRGAALVVCPGGGYTYIAIDREGHALGRYFSARGITVAVLKYRLPDPVATGGHGFGLGRDEESGRWKDAFLGWLDRLP